jgi:hypothetical protein
MRPQSETGTPGGEKVLDGKVSSVYGQTLFIVSPLGQDEVLVILPETVISVDGREAKLSDIQEGQDVRASYDDRDGRNVASRIEAGQPGATPPPSSEVGR